MYRIVQNPSRETPDTAQFVETINALAKSPREEVRSLFDGSSDIVIARAPGRIDVIGGMADYSGSLVLPTPIQEATFAAVQLDPLRRLNAVSLSQGKSRKPLVNVPLEEFERDGQPVDYEAARMWFRNDPSRHWASYVVGAFIVLMNERGLRFKEGARMLIASSVPEGKGVSSSAALEVAAMHAIAVAYDISIEPRELALLCQKVENLVAGAPCGVMDQMTAVYGEESHLLGLLCQPAELTASLPIPEEIAVWGIDSGVKHSVSGPDYGAARVGAFMGYRMIAEMAGLKVRPLDSTGRVEIDDLRWRGYLCGVTPSEFEQFYAARLPERIGGAEFLKRFSGITDTVARISLDYSYSVRVATAHPVYENHRSGLFAELISGKLSEKVLILMGELMYQSHAGYSACGLGAPETDRLAGLVRSAGPRRGLFGARITGGGCGGTVAILGRRDAESAVNDIAAQYAEQIGHKPHIFSGSSPGSLAFGHMRLKSTQEDR